MNERWWRFHFAVSSMNVFFFLFLFLYFSDSPTFPSHFNIYVYDSFYFRFVSIILRLFLIRCCCANCRFTALRSPFQLATNVLVRWRGTKENDRWFWFVCVSVVFSMVLACVCVGAEREKQWNVLFRRIGNTQLKFSWKISQNIGVARLRRCWLVSKK